MEIKFPELTHIVLYKDESWGHVEAAIQSAATSNALALELFNDKKYDEVVVYTAHKVSHFGGKNDLAQYSTNELYEELGRRWKIAQTEA